MDAGTQWQKWTEGFPTVSTKDLAIHPREQDLVIGTFGRAAWVLDDIRPLRAITSDKTILNKEISIFTPPTAYQAAYQQPTGSRFGADDLYNGENRKEGAMITYYLKEGKKAESKDDKKEDNDGEVSKEEDKKDVKTKDSIAFNIYDGDRLIRTLKYKTPEKAGFHRIYWRMDEKGPDRASRKISKRKTEPSGVKVKPGTYKVVISYGEATGETMIEVKSDPRLDVSTASINEIYEISKTLEGYAQTAANAVKQLAESKVVAEQSQKDLKELDKEKYKDQIKASGDIIKEIDTVMALYLGKDDKRQGITRNPEITVMQRIGEASGYVESRQNGITTTEKKLVQYAEDELAKALEATNTFFDTKWKNYRVSIEQLDNSPFKETKKFMMN